MDSFVIPPGPGHIDQVSRPHGVHAFVALALEYENMHPSDTRAVLHLAVTEADEGIADLDVGIELTKADLLLLKGTINALLSAIKEDDA
jgi:hypothetical protein